MPGSPDVFAALADSTRRGLLDRLAREGELPAGSLAAGLPMSQPAVSKHLRILRAARLVTVRQVGRERRYRVDPTAMKPVADWLAKYEAFWDERLDRLKDVLETTPPESSATSGSLVGGDETARPASFLPSDLPFPSPFRDRAPQ